MNYLGGGGINPKLVPMGICYFMQHHEWSCVGESIILGGGNVPPGSYTYIICKEHILRSKIIT